jgi:hypothetical protein
MAAGAGGIVAIGADHELAPLVIGLGAGRGRSGGERVGLAADKRSQRLAVPVGDPDDHPGDLDGIAEADLGQLAVPADLRGNRDPGLRASPPHATVR